MGQDAADVGPRVVGEHVLLVRLQVDDDEAAVLRSRLSSM